MNSSNPTASNHRRLLLASGADKRRQRSQAASPHSSLRGGSTTIRRSACLGLVSILPPSLELLRKVEAVLTAIGMLEDEATVRFQVAALSVEITKINATAVEGPPTRLSTLNVDQAVADWLRKRSCSD